MFATVAVFGIGYPVTPLASGRTLKFISRAEHLAWREVQALMDARGTKRHPSAGRSVSAGRCEVAAESGSCPPGEPTCSVVPFS